MSEYYLADQKAEERARQRELDKRKPQQPPARSEDVRFTLLGDFLFPTNEPQGCDPYNSTHGRTAREAWRNKHNRR
jgi:hypothetical protein